MVLPIEAMALTAFWVAPCTLVICAPISSVAFEVWVARFLTSAATTAKPLPASPARAASIVALSARRLVWSAMSLISATISPIFPQGVQQALDHFVGLGRFLDRRRRDLAGMADLAADFGD